MFDIHRKEIEWGGRTLVLETGRLARQADGAVLVSYGDTTVLCTVVARKEPRAGIDPMAVADIRDLVSHLKDRGIGVLITEHNVRETLEIIDRAYILHEGAVLMEGTPDDIVSHEDVRRVYLGERFSL